MFMKSTCVYFAVTANITMLLLLIEISTLSSGSSFSQSQYGSIRARKQIFWHMKGDFSALQDGTFEIMDLGTYKGTKQLPRSSTYKGRETLFSSV